MRVHVILPAAGLGTRMASGHGSQVANGASSYSEGLHVVSSMAASASIAVMPSPAPKQFLSIGGKPILIHTLLAFLAVEGVDAIYVAVKTQEMDRVRQQIDKAGLADHAQIFVVEGGNSRQESVAKALAEVGGKYGAAADDVILVHDAVRPLIDPATIDRTIDAVLKHGAAIVGLPAVDTIKQVERTADGALVSSTIPRERVVYAQTPQGARYATLQRAFDEAAVDEFQGTDEASLLERAGVPVVVVAGSARNFKVTQPGDLELAEFYLRSVSGSGTRQA
jgi:2-C-methyl-D-erythritol 4-phosphate cytidylyltransferase